MGRTYYFDNLRAALTALVIIHHTAIGYGASGGWCYVTPDTIKGWGQLALSALLSIDQAFFMSLFFFISAYFTPGSFDKKGFRKYIGGRFIRLGIPLFVYSVIINPCLNYAILLHTNNADTGLVNYIITSNIDSPNTSHLWFLLALLIFESLYAVYRRASRISVSAYITDRTPACFDIAVFILLTGSLAFLLRLVYPIGGKNIIGLQLGYFTLYIAMYLLGIIASRKKWLERLSYKASRAWFIVALSVIPLIVLAWINVTTHPDQVAQYIGGSNWKALFLAFWEAVVCVGFCFFLIMAFQKYLNTSNRVFANMAAASYTAYIIHPLIVVSITILFEAVPLSALYKFFIVSLMSITFCFIISHFFRKIPGVDRIL